MYISNSHKWDVSDTANWVVAPQKLYTYPNLWNLSMSPYLEKKVLPKAIKSRKWDPPGLPRWSLNPMASVLIRDRREEDAQKKGQIKKWIEIGVMNLQAKECLGPPEAERGKDRFCTRNSGGNIALRHHGFILLASRTVRQWISVALS